MKIYLAHNLAARGALVPIVDMIEKMGHEVTSTWITKELNTEEEGAITDLADIDRSDALLLFIDQFGPTPGRGKYIEFGYALAKGKKCFIYGEDKESCCFFFLPQVTHIRNLNNLQSWKKFSNGVFIIQI